MGRGSHPERLLEDRVQFETLLSDLSAGLIHVDASGLDAALERGLRQLVAFLRMDRGNLDEYIEGRPGVRVAWAEPVIAALPDRKSTRLNSSHLVISYAVFCLKKKK